ncbi:MAG: helix-turn-helix domain-containing protein [Clostridiaceae bacterium]
MKKFRISLHLSKSELSKRTGISRAYITKLELKRCKTTSRTLLKLSNGLETCPYNLLDLDLGLCVCCLNKKCYKNNFF